MISVLVACEFSGTVRDAFIAAGHKDTWSCDFLPSQSTFSEQHLECDVREVLFGNKKWDLIIAHPDCTYLTVSANKYLKIDPGCNVAPGILTGYERLLAQREALDFVRIFINYENCEHIAVENPVGAIGTKIRKACQYVQPYQFGNDACKRTGLWLKGLPQLIPTQYVAPRKVGVMKRWSNQTDSGNIRRGQTSDRWMKNAKTYEGIAKAMANQWGSFVLNKKLKGEQNGN